VPRCGCGLVLQDVADLPDVEILGPAILDAEREP
jgi:hypothetical protein